MEDKIQIIDSSQNIEYVYRTVRVGGRTYQIKRPVVPENDDFPKKKNFGQKKPKRGRPKKVKEEETPEGVDLNMQIEGDE